MASRNYMPKISDGDLTRHQYVIGTETKKLQVCTEEKLEGSNCFRILAEVGQRITEGSCGELRVPQAGKSLCSVPIPGFLVQNTPPPFCALTDSSLPTLVDISV
ncbi:hypothetical protein H671_3g8610 [Cricetulus griseus]|nr:hypothetical protein H671_3g8610 [Cricetulus griseus]